MADEQARGEMPFLDHIEELRWRILYSLAAILGGTVLGWVLVQHVDVLALFMRPIAPLVPGGRLMFTSPTEPFFITLKFAFGTGVLLASPIVGYQIWAFLSPALYPRERRLIVPALPVGVLLFVAGAAAGYAWVLPRALRVLFSFQRDVLQPIITADNYFGFAAQIVIAFGLITELPLVVVILAALGIVTPEFLARNRRYAIVLAALVAALLSPPDAVSMLLMLVPLWLLYEVSILCAWVVTRRRERVGRAGESGRVVATALLLVALPSVLGAQGIPPDTARARAAPTAPTGQPLDTATARKLGLPTGPSRSFPPSDAVMDSLLKLPGFRVTQYVADTLIVKGDSQTILLRGDAFLDRQGTKLQADSVRYRESSCRLDATGTPQLFDQGTVLVGDGMRYDTCIRRGIVDRAFTDFHQGGVTWYMRGDIAVDSGATRLYGNGTDITSDDQPVPDYHFGTGRLKWLNKHVMVARPAVLYVHDVPILWLPFIFQDIRPGRRSGVLVPGFGPNDLVRPNRSYSRHFTNVGYYWVVNNYADLLGSVDWYAGQNLTTHGDLRYHWLDRFVTGSFSYSRVDQLSAPGTASQISWTHQQSFDSRTHFNASVNYATSGTVLTQNSVDPFLATAQLTSQVNFDKRFEWGTLNIGGSRSQDLSSGQVNQTLPSVSLTPLPLNLGPSVTWSPGFSFTNQQTFHQGPNMLLVPGTSAVPGTPPVPDTLSLFYDTRASNLSFETPVPFGRWNWANRLVNNDQRSNQPVEVDFADSTAPGGVRRLFYGSTFSTTLDWQTGINLTSVFPSTWKLQPGLEIVNATSAGPTGIRNQYSNGEFVTQGKRIQLSLGLLPTFFGFFPGVGPISRIRHSISPIINYFYAPAAHVPAAFSYALDPTDTLLNSRSDPQQTITFGLSQNFEAKLKPPPRPANDTGPPPTPRKLRILSLNTDAVAYNFEQASEPGRTGWQTQTVGNTFASDLLPNFSLRVVHDLWNGPVGLSTSPFSPFLESVNANFSITPNTLAGLAHLLGLAHAPPQPQTPAPNPQNPPAIPTPGVPPPMAGAPPVPPLFGGPTGALPSPGSPVGGFMLAVSYASVRVRPQVESTTVVGVPVQTASQQLNLNLSFSPSPKWQANWTTVYDFQLKQFGEQFLRLERDLHRWHASFAFAKSPNGNFAFTFFVSLLDEPDVKFNYQQQSYPSTTATTTQ